MADQAKARPVATLTEVRQLATYASHYGNCDYASWDDELTACKCGLFPLLTRLEGRGVLKKETPDERSDHG